jgi:hypothetical protein
MKLNRAPLCRSDRLDTTDVARELDFKIQSHAFMHAAEHSSLMQHPMVPGTKFAMNANVSVEYVSATGEGVDLQKGMLGATLRDHEWHYGVVTAVYESVAPAGDDDDCEHCDIRLATEFTVHNVPRTNLLVEHDWCWESQQQHPKHLGQYLDHDMTHCTFELTIPKRHLGSSFHFLATLLTEHGERVNFPLRVELEKYYS